MLATTPQEAAPGCALHNLSIDPVSSDRRDLFVGTGRFVRVEFHNQSTSDSVRVFPEPPLVVRRLDKDASCSIDGGVWQRSSVFLSQDEKVLVVLEFSGSSNRLLAYDTANCAQTGSLDVSGKHWRIEGSEIRLGSHCSGDDLANCRNKRTVSVRALCHADHGEDHGRQR